MILQSQKILGGGGAMHVRHTTNRCSRKVHGHRYAIFLGHVSDLVRFEDAARGRKIGVNLADCMLFAQNMKWFLQVNVFAGEDGGGAFLRNLLEQVRIGPGNHILHPGQVVFFISLAEANNGLHAEMSEMVHGKGDFHAYSIAHGCNVLLEHGNAFVGDFHCQERVRKLVHLPLVQVRGIGNRAGCVGDHLDAQVHLQPG